MNNVHRDINKMMIENVLSVITPTVFIVIISLKKIMKSLNITKENVYLNVPKKLIVQMKMYV